MADDLRPGAISADGEPVPPADEHDREWVSNVHPPDHVNPIPADRYHLVVVGGGTAGLVSAAAAAGLGARVALVERRLMGGDCLNHGCVPSKAVLRAGRAWRQAETGAALFGAPPIAGPGDFRRAMERMRRLRAEISHHDSVDRFSSLGIDVFLGTGRFVSPSTVAVGELRLEFRRAVVATGARPLVPPIPGLAESGFLTNETIFGLEERPNRLGVIGAGPIGCELAQAFARLGSGVTLFDLEPRVLPRDDEDAAALVQEALATDGVGLELGARVERIELRSGEIAVQFARDGERLERRCDRLLVAVGRAANVEQLCLEAAGISAGDRGIDVDDRLRTSNRRVYAVGDVASPFMFTHVADALARIAVRNALFFGRRRTSDLVIPWCTYTQPELAHVGLEAGEAAARGSAVETITIPLSEIDRAVLDGATRGFLRLHVQRGRDRILGATLVADHAGDLIGELCLAVTHRVGLAKISDTIHPYPTQAEVVRKAADAWMRSRLTPRIRRILRLFFRLWR